jgi:hypothetical protein
MSGASTAPPTISISEVKMKLSSILAKEKKLVPTNDGELTEIQLLTRKEGLFNGFHKRYVPLKTEGEGSETLPDDSLRVQQRTDDLIVRTANLWTDIFDITFSKDKANQEAKADLKLDGQVLIEGAPVSFLLWLDKRLQEIRSYYNSIPTLNEADEWSKDTESGMWRATPVKTHRTKKITTPLVIHPPTDKHPAQCTTVQEDIIVGHYENQKFSSALPAARKRELLSRIDRLLYAVKIARSEANSMEAEERKIARPIFEYLLS